MAGRALLKLQRWWQPTGLDWAIRTRHTDGTRRQAPGTKLLAGPTIDPPPARGTIGIADACNGA